MESKPLGGAHRRLISELRTLREGAGHSGVRFGDLLDWSQSKVSKIENGRTRPSIADVEAWTAACDASDDLTQELVMLAEAVSTEVRAWSSRRGTLAARNSEIAQAEAATTHLQNFQPAVVSGLLQTAEYARRVIDMVDVTGEKDVGAAVAVRLERQTVLYDQSKTFEFILTEGALRWRPGPANLILAQLDRLMSIATLPNVTIGVLPFDQEAVALYTNGFTIFDVPDDPFVLVETNTQELYLHEAGELATYRQIFARLHDSAMIDEVAVTAIRRIMTDITRE